MSTDADFWARRKAAVAAETEAELCAGEEADLAQQQATLEALSDTEILAELQLPDPDTLVLGDDFSGFLAKAVPEHLRRRALRRLWRSNPVLANVDALVDYGEDFTDSAVVVEGMTTTYQVGKGMLKHIQEMARQAEAQAEAEADEVAAGAGDEGAVTDAEQEFPDAAPEPVDVPEVMSVPQTSAASEAAVDAATPVVGAAPDALVLLPQGRRRMRFEFDQTSDQPVMETG